jgi:hypothetical protein
MNQRCNNYFSLSISSFFLQDKLFEKFQQISFKFDHAWFSHVLITLSKVIDDYLHSASRTLAA